MKLEKIDSMIFFATTMISFAVYAATLAPEVGLSYSGYFSVAGFYAGIPMPAGFPLWTLWGWLFTHGLHFSNIEVRAALSSAVAGALTCGLIAVMVCQTGASIIEYEALPQRERLWIRGVSGYAAGMAFGLNGSIWPQAVVASPWPLNILLLCIVLWLLLRWSFAPELKWLLYTAAFIYGALFSDSQIVLCVAPAIPFFVALHDREIGRDMLLIAGVMFLAGLVLKFTGGFHALGVGGAFSFYIVLGALTCLIALLLTMQTRRAFSQWRPALACCGLAALGLLPCFYPPIAGMTNPPADWNHPRTVAGFCALLGRDQYVEIQMTQGASNFARQIADYLTRTLNEFGWPWLFVAAIPFVTVRRLASSERRRLLGLLCIYVSEAVLITGVLNPARDRSMQELIKCFDSISFLILAIFSGCGLICLGTWSTLWLERFLPRLKIAS